MLPTSDWGKAQVELVEGVYRVAIGATDYAGRGAIRIAKVVVQNGSCVDSCKY